MVALASTGLASPAYAATTDTLLLGFNFVEPPDEAPIDFLNVLNLHVHQMLPWEMTQPTSNFVTDGAFQGMSEQQVRDEIMRRVRQKLYDVPAPAGRELNIDLYSQPVSGPGSLNVAFGQYVFDSQGDHWFGQSDLGAAFDPKNGENMAVVALDEIASLPGPFDTPDKAYNAIVNVTAHEIGHLYRLEHVCAVVGSTECVAGRAVVTDPYDVMATGPSGLPVDGWLQDNPFTSVPSAQRSGLSSAGMLLANAGSRLIGDTDRDEDVDSADLSEVVIRWTGALAYDAGDRLWADGDFDHDQDVDSADLTTLIQSWTGVAAQAAGATLRYDPVSGDVQLHSGSGASLASFALVADQPIFRTEALTLPGSSQTDLADVRDDQIGQFLMAGTAAASSYDLGCILPAGLAGTQLPSVFAAAQYAWVGGGGGSFQFVVVPEPSAAVCLLLVVLPLLGLRKKPA